MRRLILEAAVRVFESKGYSQTTMDDIAAEAGVARSAMFRHFATKSDLFHAAQLKPFLDLMTTFKESLDAEIEELWEEERLMRGVIEVVYDGFRAHRNGMLAIASMRELDPVAYREALAASSTELSTTSWSGPPPRPSAGDGRRSGTWGCRSGSS